MTPSPRPHLTLNQYDAHARGVERGTLLRTTLPAAYDKYAELFRAVGISAEAERRAALTTLDALTAFRPEAATEIDGIARGSGLDVAHIAALNARTEVLALGAHGASECSTLTTTVNGERMGVQTWDWHVELQDFWHTQTVQGGTSTYVGLTEQGVLGKIGMNEHGIGLHFNILGHTADRPEGVPVHVLSAIVLDEAHDVEEAIEIIHSAPITSSSAFTLLDHHRAVSVEMSPKGISVIEEHNGSVQRTNHFQHEPFQTQQKHALYEPDSSERLALIRERLVSNGLPSGSRQLVETLSTQPGEAPLTCIPDMALGLGERWATLATVVTEPSTRTLRVLDGTPLDAENSSWKTLQIS